LQSAGYTKKDMIKISPRKNIIPLLQVFKKQKISTEFFFCLSTEKQPQAKSSKKKSKRNRLFLGKRRKSSEESSREVSISVQKSFFIFPKGR